MKKIVVGVLVVFSAALSIVHWQLSRAMAQLVHGAELHIGSATVTVPELHEQSRAIFPPAVRLGAIDVTVALTDALPVTVQLQHAQLGVALWSLKPQLTSDATTIRVADAAIEASAAATLRGMMVGFDIRGRIERVAAQELIVLSDAKPSILFEQLAVEYRAGQNLIPNAMALRVGALRLPSRRENSTDNMLELRNAAVRFEAPTPGDPDAMQTFTVKSDLGDTQLRWPNRGETQTLTIKPFVGRAAAKIRNLSADEWRQLIDDVRQKMPDWQHLSQQVDTGTGEAKINVMMTGIVDGLLRSGIVPTSSELRWDGFTLTDEKGAVRAQMKPSEWKGAFSEGAAGVQSTMDGRWGDVTFQGGSDEVSGVIAGGVMNAVTTYPESTYTALLASSTQGMMAPLGNLQKRPLTAGAIQVAQSLAQWASKSHVAFGLETVQLQSPRNTTSLTKLRYTLEQDGATLKAQVSSAIVAQTLPPGLPAAQWENGAATVALGVTTAWSDWHALRPQLSAEKFPAEQFVNTCIRKPHEVSLGVDLHGGNLGFDIALQTAVAVDGAAIQLETAGDSEAMLRSFMNTAVQQVLPTVRGQLTLTIDKIKALRQFIDAVSPGMSDIMLAQAQMFVVVDESADTLRSELRLHDGKWMVNGQSNPMLDMLFQELVGK